MENILSFDIGTTSVKACVFNQELKIIGSSTREYQVLTPENGYVELPAEEYWEAAKAGAAEALAFSGVPGSEIAAVAITTQGETLIPVDKEGRPLHNALVWLDERAGLQASHISESFPPQCFYFHTGIPECTGFCPVSKLLWFKEQLPEVYNKTYKFLLLEDFILQRLTGKFVTERSLMCTTGYYDIGKDKLWDEMLTRIGVSSEKLPEVLDCGAVVGHLLPEAAQELAISPEAVAVTAAMDQTAGAVGAGNLFPGIVTETTGTAMCIGATADAPDMDHPSRVCVYTHIYRGKYLLIPVCMTAGMVLKWFKDEFCSTEIKLAQTEGCSVYDLLGKLAACAPPGARGLTLIPYLTGVIQPDNDPKARGVFFGVGLDTGKAEFIRAIFEGIAYMLRENVALIEAVDGQKVTAIRSLGGGSKSRVWRQMKADVCGVEISSMAETECTSLGAAVIASVALGWYRDAETAVSGANRVSSRLLPDHELREFYEKGFERYRRIYLQAKPIFDEM